MIDPKAPSIILGWHNFFMALMIVGVALAISSTSFADTDSVPNQLINSHGMEHGHDQQFDGGLNHDQCVHCAVVLTSIDSTFVVSVRAGDYSLNLVFFRRNLYRDYLFKPPKR